MVEEVVCHKCRKPGLQLTQESRKEIPKAIKQSEGVFPGTGEQKGFMEADILLMEA